MGNKGKKMIGVLLLSVILIIVLLSIQTGEVVSINTGFVKSITESPFGDKVITYEVPQFLTPEQEKALKKYTEEVFYSDVVPQTYVQQAQKQNSTISTSGNITNIGVNKTETEKTGEPVLYSSSNAAKVVKRGESFSVAGKIEKVKSPPPYFFNVLITCCGMNSFKAMSAVETDALGNFLVKIYTDGHYPLGDYTMTISTIGDDAKIVAHNYYFRLVE